MNTGHRDVIVFALDNYLKICTVFACLETKIVHQMYASL